MIKTLHTIHRLKGVLALALLCFGTITTALAIEDTKRPFKLEKDAMFLPGKLVVKMKPGMDISALAIFNSKLGLSTPKRMFPLHQTPASKQLKKGFTDLSTIYEFTYSSGMDMETAVNLIQKLGQVEYVCPKYIYSVEFTPNDALINRQTHLNVIGAYQAWDQFQGDTTVSIGIVDSGVDWDHPDLVRNLQYNYNDPIDGVDNDNDGYVDNNRGWDLAGADYNAVAGDNEPGITAGNNSHGTHVAGICAASTNNTRGVAGIGFKCRYLPIKCSADNDTRAGGSGYILTGYEGITYAADHGCQVINCSWGGTGQSPLGADIIRYAQINRNSLVVCAAGNNNANSEAFYPSSYPGVLSVAALNDDDTKAGFSNFGNLVGIAAPGVDVYATFYNDTYAALSGTSMASPVIAGAAALIRAKFPTLTPEQVTTILQTSSHDVSGQNGGFVGQLGSGRLDLLGAVNFQGPGVKITKVNVTDGNNNFFQGRDTLSISGLFRNLLFPSSPELNVKITLASTSARILAGSDTLTLGYMGSMDTVNTLNRPFRVALNAIIPTDLALNFKLQYTDTSGTWSEFFTVIVNPTYANFTWNNISSTAVSTGRMGYANVDQGKGIGVLYKGKGSLIYEASMMMGTNATNLSNAARNSSGSADNHFSRRSAPLPLPSVQGLAPMDIRGVFSDANNAQAYGLTTKYDVLGFGGVADTNYFVQVLTVRNTSVRNYDAFYAGYFADPDISSSGQADRCNFDSVRSMGYVFQNEPGGIYYGMSTITGNQTQFYAIDNSSEAIDSIGVYDGFTMAEKFQTLSSGIAVTNAGYQNNPGRDVSFTIGSGPYNLPAGDSIKLAYAFMVGKDLASLQIAADQARQNTIDLVVANKMRLSALSGISLMPNPGKSRISIKAREAINSITFLDPTGRTAAQILPSGRLREVPVEVGKLTPGLYLVVVKTANGTASLKFVKE